MQHSVYLQGELGERFGNKFIVNTCQLWGEFLSA